MSEGQLFRVTITLEEVSLLTGNTMALSVHHQGLLIRDPIVGTQGEKFAYEVVTSATDGRHMDKLIDTFLTMRSVSRGG